MSNPIIETARLTLRPPIQADLDGWAQLAADATAMRFLGGAQARSVAWRSMATVAGSWALRDFGMFSVVERATGRWIGCVGPWQPEGWPGTEVGWSLGREAWGRGYATEAATAAMSWAVGTLGWSDIIHVIDPGNVASVAVATRLGSTRREPGQLPAPLEDRSVEIWGQTANQWRRRA